MVFEVPAQMGEGAPRPGVIVESPGPLRDSSPAWSTGGGWLLPRGRVDHRADPAHDVGREAAAFGVLEDGLLVLGDVDAVDLVAGHVAVLPLGTGRHVGQDLVGLGGDGVELGG